MFGSSVLVRSSYNTMYSKLQEGCSIPMAASVQYEEEYALGAFQAFHVFAHKLLLCPLARRGALEALEGFKLGAGNA